MNGANLTAANTVYNEIKDIEEMSLSPFVFPAILYRKINLVICNSNHSSTKPEEASDISDDAYEYINGEFTEEMTKQLAESFCKWGFAVIKMEKIQLKFNNNKEESIRLPVLCRWDEFFLSPDVNSPGLVKANSVNSKRNFYFIKCDSCNGPDFKLGKLHSECASLLESFRNLSTVSKAIVDGLKKHVTSKPIIQQHKYGSEAKTDNSLFATRPEINTITNAQAQTGTSSAGSSTTPASFVSESAAFELYRFEETNDESKVIIETPNCLIIPRGFELIQRNKHEMFYDDQLKMEDAFIDRVVATLATPQSVLTTRNRISQYGNGSMWEVDKWNEYEFSRLTTAAKDITIALSKIFSHSFKFAFTGSVKARQPLSLSTISHLVETNTITEEQAREMRLKRICLEQL